MLSGGSSGRAADHAGQAEQSKRRKAARVRAILARRLDLREVKWSIRAAVMLISWLLGYQL